MRDVMPRLVGRATVVRYPDDIAILFQVEQDAQRVMNVMPKRFDKNGLTLDPEKARLIDFRRPARKRVPVPRPLRLESFNLLGFTRYRALSRKGNWVGSRESRRTVFGARSGTSLSDVDVIDTRLCESSGKASGQYCSAFKGISKSSGTWNPSQLQTSCNQVLAPITDRRSQKSRVSWETMCRLL